MSTDDLSVPPSEPSQARAALSLARHYFERRRDIAGTLHDGFVQYMVGAKMWLESMAAEPLSEDGKSALTTALGALSSGVEDARHLVRQLSPGSSAAPNLSLAITESVMRYRSTVEREVDLAIRGNLIDLDEELYIVARGVVHDIFEFSRELDATIVSVFAERRQSQLEIQFGFTEPLKSQHSLQPLHVLMRAVGGELLGTAAPSGSALIARFPIP